MAEPKKLFLNVNFECLFEITYIFSHFEYDSFFRDLYTLSNKAHQNANVEQITVCERLALLLDVLISHKDLCERLEKGLAHDHQQALQKMLSLKKRKIQGVIRGTDVSFFFE